MDSVTQATLGAAVGELVLGKKVGKKAPLWGAAAGTLPEFSWLNAKEEACDHPCHDIAKGERAVKDIYEALRAGPKWQNTL